MKKVLKKILCILFFNSFIISSYCSLTSDGRVFITKAEFDSTLADFHGRLTNFETTINSKIDSQVTSYLDRNGIWSGKLQERNEVDCKAIFSPQDLIDEGYVPTGVSGEIHDVVDWDKKEYIHEINKSGLLVGKWYWTSYGGANTANTKWGWSGNISGNYQSDAGFLLSIVLVEIRKNSSVENIIYNNSFMSAMGRRDRYGDNTYFSLFAPLSVAKMYYPLQLFVNNGSTLKWHLECDFRFPPTSNIYALTDNNSKLLIEWEEPRVY